MENKLKLLVLSDTHLGFDYPMRPRIKIRRRAEEFFSNFNHVLNYGVKNKVDFILHLGDLFFRCKVHNDIVKRAYSKLLSTADKGIKIIIVPGNHDCSRLPLISILSHPNIYIFERPKVFSFPFQGKNINFAGFPFIRKNLHEEFQKCQNIFKTDISTNDVNLLLMHQTVQGAQVGQINYTFGSGPDILLKKMMPQNYDLILCGHIHRHQILPFKHNNQADFKGKVIFSGSTERTSFAEKNETKGFLKIGSDPAINNPIEHLDFVPLPSRKMADIQIDSENSIEAVMQTIKLEVNELNSNSIVRLKFEKNFHQGILNQLTTGLIRSLVPESMNIEISRSSFVDRN